MTFKERYLEEVATTSGSTSTSSTSIGSRVSSTSSPSNISQMLKNTKEVQSSPTHQGSQSTTPSLGGPLQKAPELNSGFFDLNYKKPSDTPTETLNDLTTSSRTIALLTGKKE